MEFKEYRVLCPMSLSGGKIVLTKSQVSNRIQFTKEKEYTENNTYNIESKMNFIAGEIFKYYGDIPKNKLSLRLKKDCFLINIQEIDKMKQSQLQNILLKNNIAINGKWSFEDIKEMVKKYCTFNPVTEINNEVAGYDEKKVDDSIQKEMLSFLSKMKINTKKMSLRDKKEALKKHRIDKYLNG